MGLCNSKRSVKKHSKQYAKRFNPVDSKASQKSHVSHSSTRAILTSESRSHTYGNQPSSKSNGKNNENNNVILNPTASTIKSKNKNKFHRNSRYYYDFFIDFNNDEDIIYEDKEDKYYMDIHELEHVLLQNVWNNYFSNPIEENLSRGQLDVLDVACGPGYWICDMAIEFSKSQFIGIQAFPIPKKPNFPHNANFLRIDILNGLPYDADSFNFVHLRILSPKYTEEQWEIIIAQMTRVTKPGGYCELEVGDYFTFENEGPLLKEVNIIHRRCLEESGIQVNITSKLEDIMKYTNKFSSLNKEFRSIPIGRSSGKYGEMASSHFIQTLNTQKENISSYLGQTLQEFDDRIVDIISELDNYKSTCYRCIRIFGRKIENIEKIEEIDKIEYVEKIEKIE